MPLWVIGTAKSQIDDSSIVLLTVPTPILRFDLLAFVGSKFELLELSENLS